MISNEWEDLWDRGVNLFLPLFLVSFGGSLVLRVFFLHQYLLKKSSSLHAGL